MLNPFYKEGSTATQMYRCPNCSEMISIQAVSCRHCGSAIDPSTAQRLLVESQKVTDAVTASNTFRLSIWVAAIGMVLGPALLFSGPRVDYRFILVLATATAALLYAMQWFARYGALQTNDTDYPESRSAMKRTLIVWTVSMAVQLAALALFLVSNLRLAGARPNWRLHRSRRNRCVGIIQRVCAGPVNLGVGPLRR